MNERGTTLVEVLAAVALLALLASALAAWTTTTARTARAVEGPLAWEAAARATMRQIEDDLLVGDEVGGPDAADRVAVSDGTLRVRTRERGPVIATYRVEAEAKAKAKALVRHAGPRTDRLLVGVEGWEVSIAKGCIDVELHHPRFGLVGRRWSVP